MGNSSFNSVYIIAAAVALASMLVPGEGNIASAQVSLPSVTDDLTRLPPDLDIERRTATRLQRSSDRATKLALRWVDTAELTVDQAAAQATGLANGLLRDLVLDQDPTGADIEQNIVVVLVDTEELSRLSRAGFDIIAERELASLGLTMLTLRLPANGDLPQAMERLRKANPGAEVDYNHLYDFATNTPQSSSAAVAQDTPPAAVTDSPALRIGIIDSAVMPEHPGIAGIDIVHRDFATSPGLRPQTHGTAVASLVAKSAQQPVSVVAASVFFQMPNRAPGATAESLVAALDWLVAENVDVINMSLAGPGNELLEAAVARLVQMDAPIIAAVGNNGPSGEPLYPAAYDGVIGVTAVDRKNRIFRYANRGEQVDFAARGVDVKVADSLSGGWRIESGTSMASPHVAVVIATLLRSGTVSMDALNAWLIANAEDLGRRGLDPVYGHGLITRPPIVLSAN